MFVAAAAEFPNDNPSLHRGACWVLAGLDEGLVAVGPGGGGSALEAGRALEAMARASGPGAGAGPVVEGVGLEGAAVEGAPSGGASTMEVEGRAGAAERPLGEQMDDIGDVEPTVPTPRVSETVAVRGAEAEVVDADGRLAMGVEAEETPAPSSAERAAVIEDGFSRFVGALVEIAQSEGARAEARVLPALLALEGVGTEGVGSAVRGLVSGGFGVEADGVLRASERLAGLVRAWSGVLRGTGDFSACGAETLNEWAADLLAALLGDPGRAAAMQYQLRRRGVAAFGMVQLAA